MLRAALDRLQSTTVATSIRQQHQRRRVEPEEHRASAGEAGPDALRAALLPRLGRVFSRAFLGLTALAGLAGSLKALVFQIATLTDVSWTTSGEALLMVIVGGMQTLAGPRVGALVKGLLRGLVKRSCVWGSEFKGSKQVPPLV